MTSVSANMSARWGQSARGTSAGLTPPHRAGHQQAHAHRRQEHGDCLGRHDDGAVVHGIDPELLRQGQQDRR